MITCPLPANHFFEFFDLDLSKQQYVAFSHSKYRLYHCPFEIGLCIGKGGHGRLGRVETGLLSRTLPTGTKGADRSTQARRAVPLYSNPKASGFWYEEVTK